MRRKCCVSSCNSGVKCRICQVSLSYFKTPRDPSMIKKWEHALGFRDQRLQSRDRVCSLHFEKCDMITKRFVSLKRPATNSKMILEITKLERNAVPLNRPESKSYCCIHGRGNKRSSTKLSRSESMSVGSSQSEESDESLYAKDDRESQLTRKDYISIMKSMENRSKRRKIRALGTLRLKWLEKKKNLEKNVRLLEDKICELNYERDENVSVDSD